MGQNVVRDAGCDRGYPACRTDEGRRSTATRCVRRVARVRAHVVSTSWRRRRRLRRQRPGRAPGTRGWPARAGRSTGGRTSAATRTTSYDDAGMLDPPLRPAHLPHQLGATSSSTCRSSPSGGPTSTACWRSVDGQLRADPDQPRHRQPALRAEPRRRSSWRRSSPSRRRAARARSGPPRTRSSSKVGRELYEKFFRGYTRKQWGLDPSELDAPVTARVPTRTNRDDRYFTDTFQAMPQHGYTRMFERMLAHPNIKVMLNTDYREIDDVIPYRADGLHRADRRVLRLPLRQAALPLAASSARDARPAERSSRSARCNYPNDYAYTRITEFKHLTGQQHPRTTIVYEYPRAEGDPYYPMPRPENAALYRKLRGARRTHAERPLRRPAGDVPATTTWTRSWRRRWRPTTDLNGNGASKERPGGTAGPLPVPSTPGQHLTNDGSPEEDAGLHWPTVVQTVR